MVLETAQETMPFPTIAVVNEIDPLMRPESTASRLNAIEGAFVRGEITHVTITVDGTHGAPRVKYIYFEMLGADGTLSRITGASPVDIAERFDCPQLTDHTPESTPQEWQHALDTMTSNNVAFDHVPVTIRIKKHGHHIHKHHPEINVNPNAIITDDQRERMNNILSDSDKRILIEITSRDKQNPVATVYHGDGKVTTMRVSALALGLGMAGTNILALSPDEFAKKLAMCTYKGKRLPILFQINHKFIFPGYIRSVDTQKQARENQSEYIWDHFDEDAAQAVLDELDEKQWKREAAIFDYNLNPPFDLEPTKQDGQKRREPYVEDYSVAAGYLKRSPAEIARWERRNIDPKQPWQRRKHYIGYNDPPGVRYYEHGEWADMKGKYGPIHQEINLLGKRKELPSKLERRLQSALLDAQKQEEQQTRTMTQTIESQHRIAVRRLRQEDHETTTLPTMFKGIDLSWPRPGEPPYWFVHSTDHEKWDWLRKWHAIPEPSGKAPWIHDRSGQAPAQAGSRHIRLTVGAGSRNMARGIR